jgi:hypothetical protein
VQTPAEPCATKGSPLYWSGSNIGYVMNQAGSVQVTVDVAVATTQQAFHNWTSPGCPADIPSCGGTSTSPPSIGVSYQGTTATHAAEFKDDGADQNVILFWDSGWPHPSGDSTLALTTVTFNTSSGEIRDVDIEVNSDPSIHKLAYGDTLPNDAFDLPSIFQHETGHFLGLAHTQPANTSASMSAHYVVGETFMRTPSADDVCGICTIYPPGRSTYQTERGGCHCAVALGAPNDFDFDVALVACVGVAMLRTLRRRRF